MKKLRLLALSAAAVACAGTIALTTSCSGSGTKFGFIFLHDEKSTYDKNFIEAAKTACENKGVKAVLTTNNILKNVKTTPGQKYDNIVSVTIEGDLP